MMRWFVSTMLTLALLALPAIGSAQTDSERAKEHYDDGAALYFKGEYADAVLAFMRAYEALPEPVFMYNIAMSHWRLGNLDKAIESAETALDAELDPGLHAQVSARNLVFHQIRHIEESDWKSADPSVAEPATDPVVVAEPDPVSPGERSKTLRWVAIGSAVAGTGLLVGFTVTELGLQRTIEDYEAAAAAGDEQRYDELKADIERRQPISLALLWSGAGLLALGGTLFVVDLLGSSSGETALIIGPGSVSARVAW